VVKRTGKHSRYGGVKSARAGEIPLLPFSSVFYLDSHSFRHMQLFLSPFWTYFFVLLDNLTIFRILYRNPCGYFLGTVNFRLVDEYHVNFDLKADFKCCA
jgi:hypothetical protein